MLSIQNRIAKALRFLKCDDVNIVTSGGCLLDNVLRNSEYNFLTKIRLADITRLKKDELNVVEKK